MWRMEDILDLYEEPYDAQRPILCFDEMPYQLIGEVLTPLPMKPGKPQRYDYTYKRNGTCNLFMCFQPHAGWRHIRVTSQRTKHDYARCMKTLADDYFPHVTVIRMVQDNLNIHTPAALYEVFPPQEARRLVKKFEFHYTPKHASWLNMAEIELSVLSNQCLDRRIPDIGTVQQEVAFWEHDRNAKRATVDWEFTSQNARVKLERLYPSTYQN